MLLPPIMLLGSSALGLLLSVLGLLGSHYLETAVDEQLQVNREKRPAHQEYRRYRELLSGFAFLRLLLLTGVGWLSSGVLVFVLMWVHTLRGGALVAVYGVNTVCAFHIVSWGVVLVWLIARVGPDRGHYLITRLRRWRHLLFD